MAVMSVENINEAEIDIDNKSWEHEDVRQLWCKNHTIFTYLSDFWKPLMLEGKKLMDYMHGQIFDESVRSEYQHVLGKVPIEPKIMKGRINTLAGHIKQTLRSGKVTSEGGMSAAELSTANMILKYFRQETDEEFLMNEALVNGITTCMPQCIWFDKTQTAYGNQMAGLLADILPWDSFLLEKFFKKADGEDNHQICRIMRQNEREILEENPNRESQIRDHFRQIKEENFNTDLINQTGGVTAEDARNIYSDIITGARNTRLDGKQLVVERLSPVKVDVEIAIKMDTFNENTLDYQVRPGTWSNDRWNVWKIQHAREYVFVKKKVNLLWQSRWTGEGLMLQNRLHWFQEHDKRGDPILPIAIFTPQIIDGLPTGPGADMKHKILMKAISETEYLHDVRTGAGDLLVYIGGAVVNYSDLPRELSEGNGIAILDAKEMQGRKINDVIDFIKRTPNDAHRDYSEKIDRDLEQTDLVTPALLGQHAPRQAAKAKSMEIAQALLGYSIISDNFNKSYMRMKNLQCMLIPYVFTEEQTLQIQDEETGEPVDVTVNETEHDINGNGSVVANDLSSVHWRWRLVEADDSPTQKQAELKEMLIFWNTAAPSLIEADDSLLLLASVLKSMGNKTANKVGTILEQKAQVKAEQMSQQEMARLMAELEERKAKADAERIKAMRSGFSFSVTAEDLSTDPGMYKILVESGYINETNNNFQLPSDVAMAA